jgi:hypothetical protein
MLRAGLDTGYPWLFASTSDRLLLPSGATADISQVRFGSFPWLLFT